MSREAWQIKHLRQKPLHCRLLRHLGSGASLLDSAAPGHTARAFACRAIHRQLTLKVASPAVHYQAHSAIEGLKETQQIEPGTMRHPGLNSFPLSGIIEIGRVKETQGVGVK